ncbi:MAG: cytochrome b/b6 domain-containing protein [Rhodocyclaceae bacterium]
MSAERIQVWDLPLRLFHWLLFGLVVAAIVSVKIGGTAMVWHGRFGHMIFGLIVFRIVWGVIGSDTARFTTFVRGPAAILDYLKGRWQGIGHNPLGALSVLALLGVIGFQATSGLFANDDIAFTGPLYRAVASDVSGQLTGWHKRMEWVIYALIALHVAAVLFYTLIRKDDLVGPMITGRKRVSSHRAEPTRGGGVIAFVVALAIAGLAMWVSSGALLAPPPPPPASLGW